MIDLLIDSLTGQTWWDKKFSMSIWHHCSLPFLTEISMETTIQQNSIQQTRKNSIHTPQVLYQGYIQHQPAMFQQNMGINLSITLWELCQKSQQHIQCWSATWYTNKSHSMLLDCVCHFIPLAPCTLFSETFQKWYCQGHITSTYTSFSATVLKFL